MLGHEGYEVVRAAEGQAGIDRATEDRFDLIVLDLGLPDVDGLEVCRRVRQVRPDQPILMLTARAEEIDTVVGLDAGADDYVTKPFRLAELLARVRALLRRTAEPLPGPTLAAAARCASIAALAERLGRRA